MLQITNVEKTFNKGTINEKKALQNLNLKMNIVLPNDITDDEIKLYKKLAELRK